MHVTLLVLLRRTERSPGVDVPPWSAHIIIERLFCSHCSRQRLCLTMHSYVLSFYAGDKLPIPFRRISSTPTSLWNFLNERLETVTTLPHPLYRLVSVLAGLVSVSLHSSRDSHSSHVIHVLTRPRLSPPSLRHPSSAVSGTLYLVPAGPCDASFCS